MPPLPVIADVFRLTAKWTSSAGGLGENVMHFKQTAATAIDISTDFAASITQTMWGPVSAQAWMYEYDIIKLDGSSSTVTFPGGVSGKWQGGGGNTDPVVAPAGLVKQQTGLRGQANRGRIYLPFVAEGQQANGALAGAIVTSTQTAWDTFLTAMTAAASLPVVASYDRINGGAGAHSTIIVKYVVEGILGTQRRRQTRLR
jgi:hypothetical protein